MEFQIADSRFQIQLPRRLIQQKLNLKTANRRNDNMHHLLELWFSWVLTGGYVGIIVLMAMSSSPLPVPAEVVIPPAAFLAAQGKLSFTGVILAGTLGSYLWRAAMLLDFALDWATTHLRLRPLRFVYPEQNWRRRSVGWGATRPAAFSLPGFCRLCGI